MRNERGFTLAELLVAIAVVGLLMSALFVTLLQGQSAFLFGAGRAEVQQNGRLALAKMIEELRTGSAVTAVTATSVTFLFLDDAGVSTTVQYSLAGTNVQRNQTVPAPAAAQPETLVGGVTSLTVTCFDQNDAVTAVPANAFSVQVRITTQPERPLAGYSPANQQVVFQDRVKMRNK